jgi:hypothetical protein
MKLLKPFLLLLVFSTLLCSSMKCKKDNIGTQEPTLPAATQIGANTFGCLIDGRLFLPKDKFPTAGLTAKIQFNNLSILTFNGNDFINIRLQNFDHLGNYSVASGNEIEYLIDGLSYKWINGEINILKYDKIKNILSGQFNFVGKDAKTGKLVNVTDGRFDVIFTIN